MPGGKPEQNEEIQVTLARELLEETSIDIAAYGIVARFFGYYLIEGDTSKSNPTGSPYLQVRFKARIDRLAKEVNICVNENSTEKEPVTKLEFVDLNEVRKYLHYFKQDSEELLSLKEQFS